MVLLYGMKVFVIGVIGFVGWYFVFFFFDVDYDVVVFVCDVVCYDGLFGVEVVEGDIFELVMFDFVMVGVDVVYYFIYLMYVGGDFEVCDWFVVCNFVDVVGFVGVE